MSRVPEPELTPEGPAYEGRLLVRPDDEVVDQGAGFDIRTMLSRRGVLSLVGVGVGAATLAACSAGSASGSSTSSAASTSTGSASSGSTSSDSSSSESSTGSSESSTSSESSATTTAADGEIPEETNGPYPADGTTELNILEESGIVRSDITSSLDGGATVEGVPLTFTFSVTDMANDNAPFEGAALYAWQCDAQGLYSMYSQGVEDETFLRGVQIADADGNLTFQTIVPGCYTGRWTHIHFEVYPDADSATDVANVIATSQLAFPADMLSDVYALDTYSGSAENLAGVGTDITDDDIFAEGDWELQVPTITGDVDSGYTATLAVGVDTTTENTGAGSGGGGGAPGGDGGGSGQGGGEPPSDGGSPPSN